MPITGKVVRFDEFRGYGFVTPDTGGEDVFIHVNDLDFDKALLGPGARVEFDVEEGERGLKASHVQLLEQAVRGPMPVLGGGRQRGEDEPSDALSEREYLEEVTEILLRAAPAATAEQILNIRQHLVRSARHHGWVVE